MSTLRSNKSIIASWMENQEHHLHKHRLHTVKSSIDNKRPYTPKFLKKKQKKKQMQRESKAEIQRRNNMLLDKLYTIDTKSNRLHPAILQRELPPSRQTLNRNMREQKLSRLIGSYETLDECNRKILEKIQNVESKYSIENIMRETF